VRLEDAEPAGQLRRRQPSGELEQREWVSPGLEDDLLSNPFVQDEPHRGAEQGAGVAVLQALHFELGQMLELRSERSRGEHDADRLSEQAPGDERERQRRGLIEPLGVVDDAEHGLLLGDIGEQAQHGQPDEEPIGSVACAQAERDLEGLALRDRESLEPSEKRQAQLVQARESELHLGLHSDRTQDREV
jgi:hypothetical protein